ncbi:MAG: VWA domain-containing protein [Alphaproteobacteria bacterium]
MADQEGKLPSTSSRGEVDEFLRKVAETRASAAPSGRRGRLVFAMDATASREPTWDQAIRIQSDMFRETAALGGLEIQLVYYRGLGECRASGWVADAERLCRLMLSVRCLGGPTQIERVFRHVAAETREAEKVNALVFVGDCMEEEVDRLALPAGELGLLGVPAFLFHEGTDSAASRAFQHFARLTGGACCRFDATSPHQLRELLSAVAVYAAGGRRALLEYSRRTGGMARLLAHQPLGGP